MWATLDLSASYRAVFDTMLPTPSRSLTPSTSYDAGDTLLRRAGRVRRGQRRLPTRDDGARVFPGFENYADVAETRRRLTAYGDEPVLELLEPSDDDLDDVDEAALLAARAADAHTIGAVWAIR